MKTPSGMTKKQWEEAKKLHKGTLRYLEGPFLGPNRHARRSARHHKAEATVVHQIKGPVEVVTKGRAVVNTSLYHRAKAALHTWFGGKGK